MTTVDISRSKLYGCGRPIGRLAWVWLYEAVSSDGRRFDNRSIATLRQRLRQVYGRDVEIRETWKAPAAT